ncbi:MAG: hypothetical protein Q8T08_06250, partial [Ignavibacteria bacterium]|nr:hypothetical protein [Ignavibacteria bacterium]
DADKLKNEHDHSSEKNNQNRGDEWIHNRKLLLAFFTQPGGLAFNLSLSEYLQRLRCQRRPFL